MRLRLQRAVGVAVAVAAVSSFPGCGGDSPRPPVVVITPEPVRGVIAQASLSGFQPDVWISIDLLLSQKGQARHHRGLDRPGHLDVRLPGPHQVRLRPALRGHLPLHPRVGDEEPQAARALHRELEPATYYLVLYNVPRDPRTGIGSDNTESISIQLGLTVSANGQRSTEAVRLGRPAVVPPPALE